MTYRLSPQGVFRTFQGEGVMLGTPMTFVRFAGCPIGCAECDTDYSTAGRESLEELVRKVTTGEPVGGWVFLTGGEPTVWDLNPLVDLVRASGRKVAMVTSGMSRPTPDVDFLNVSPHCRPEDTRWIVRSGDQINLVPTLNGLNLDHWSEDDCEGFCHRWVTPNSKDPDSLRECLAFIERCPTFRLGVQAHLSWGLP